MRRSVLILTAAGLSGACVETVLPPEPTPQVSVSYGERLYVVDPQSSAHCRLAGEVVTSSDTQTIGGEPAGPEFGTANAINCFVKLDPGALRTDVHEVTNAQYQLCVDSDVCKKPNPEDVEQAPVCIDEDRFWDCPVVSVPQTEARRYCEWTGRRLPTAFEHMALRQRVRSGNQVTTPSAPAQIPRFPTGNNSLASCDDAVLKGCNKPYPIDPSLEDPKPAASRDVTADGVFDLTGNVSEWVSDLVPSLRGQALENLPWFCVGTVPTSSTGATTCPADATCVFGRRVIDGQARDNWPLCVVSPSLQVANGIIGATAGGNFTSDPNVSGAGPFTRRVFQRPDGDLQAIQGFRCVGVPGGTPNDTLTGVDGPL